MLKYKKALIAFSILPQILLIKVLTYFPSFVELWYSQGLYIFISKALRFSLGWIPFSFGDILYTGVGIYIIRWTVINRKRIANDTKNWILDVLIAMSMGYFAFHMLWAFNYYRLPLHQSLDLDSEYTTEELVQITKQLTIRANTIHNSIASSDSIKVVMPYTKKEILEMVPDGYASLSEKFPYLTYSQRSIKTSLYSLPLTYMGFSGYLNPFTNEAHIDGLIPSFKFPTTASHEVSHQLGYAAENEANFIGSMAAMNHPDVYFQYSGTAFALRHCLNELYRRDPETYKLQVKMINPGIIKNYEEVRTFWDSYENPLEPLFKTTYNNYLKANNQSEGMNSYSYVVALLVNYYKENPLE